VTRVHLVAGARPNFMKVGPVYHALRKTEWADPVLVHTGQHFSEEMVDFFIRDLELPPPHVSLMASAETHAKQTAAVMVAYEEECVRRRPDWVVVAGDVNSTLAACVTAKKLQLPVAHLEAGLRSGDRTMPEEINRLVVDAISDLFWTTSRDADDNLVREGIRPERIAFVGNTMIDAYCLLEKKVDAAAIPDTLGLRGKRYVVMTLHRPVNVDERSTLTALVEQIVSLQRDIPVVFPVHPRTEMRLKAGSLWTALQDAGVQLLAPLGYIEFMSLVKGSALVVTDSGGVQEETTHLGIPCLTARETTERPITIAEGTNELVCVARVAERARHALSCPTVRRAIPLWDGRAAERVVQSLHEQVLTA
jgi:UDP-N-acetylglucosamine 2-epimerase (non-hydrolysing)